MIKNTFQKPAQNEMFYFVCATHNLEGNHQTKLTLADVTKTYQNRGVINPFADGHLRAIGYIFDIIDKDFFPVKNPVAVADLPKSTAALFWLRDLHYKMMEPIASGVTTYDDPNAVARHAIGKYRQVEAALTERMAPHPSLIPQILHLWINDLAAIHCPVKEKAKLPFQLSKDEADQLAIFANQSCLLLSTLQPFQHGSNRLARLVEMALRFQWRLPFKPLTDDRYRQFIQELGRYQHTTLLDYVQRAQSVR